MKSSILRIRISNATTEYSDLLVYVLLDIQACLRCQGRCICPEERRADGKEYVNKVPVVVEQMPQVYASVEERVAGLRSHFKIH
jgi:hypothetical protein